MVKNQTKLFALGIILIVLLSACGGGLNVGNENEDNALEDLPPEIQELIAQSEILPDFPLISQLSASPSVVGPGETVTLSGDPNLYGAVTIAHASETDSLEFSSGSGSYTVPADAPDGVYIVSLENDEGATAIGSFRVASSPGIWLSTGGRYVGAEEFIKVSVTAYQVPLEMFAVFQLGLLVEEDIPEDEIEFEAPDLVAFDGPTAYLVPTASGELRLGGLPGVPLSEIVDQTFLLPGKFANRIQVSALNAEIAQLLADGDYEALDAFDEGESPEFFQILSNIVSIQQCSQPGEVSGNLGGPGTLRAISLDGELITRSVSTENGSFTIQLPAGKAMIEGWREDGSGITYFPRQVVEVPCGAGVEVSLAVISSPHLASLSLDFPFYTIDSQAGGGGEICEKIFINPPVDSSIEYEDADQLISAWAAQIDGGLDRASVASFFDNKELMKQAAQDQLRGGGGSDQLDAASENLSGNILVGSVINKFVDGRWFASVKAYDVSTGMGTPFARVTISGMSLEELRTLPTSFIEKIQKAAICAKIDPIEKSIGPNEEVNLVIEMTDLNGEAHDEVKIKMTSKSPECGDLEWTQKSITALSVTNKYTANDKLSCTDTLEFVGETEGPQGMIESLPEDATAKLIKADLWHFNMTMVVRDPDGGGSIDFTWDADFHVDEDGAVKTVNRPEAPDATLGKFTSQNSVCRVYENGVLVFQSEHLNPNATWDIELGGSMKILENGFVDIKIVPVGTSWNFSMTPLPDECFRDLFSDFLTSFLKLLALQPQTFIAGGVYQFGGMTDEPLTINFPFGAPFSDFVVTITKAPTLVNQP